MTTNDLRAKYPGGKTTRFSKYEKDDLWTDDYVLWLEKIILTSGIKL